MRQAPKPLDEVSVWISTGRSGLKYFRSGTLKMSDLISSKACCSFASQVNATSFFRSVLSGSDLVDRSSENLERYVTTPSSLLTSSFLFVGWGWHGLYAILFKWVWFDSFVDQCNPHVR